MVKVKGKYTAHQVDTDRRLLVLIRTDTLEVRVLVCLTVSGDCHLRKLNLGNPGNPGLVMQIQVAG